MYNFCAIWGVGIVSDIMALPVKEQEYLIEKEFENINLTNFAILSKKHYDKRIFTRSRNDVYEYLSDLSLEQVEEISLKKLNENGWMLIKTRIIDNSKKTYILQKDDLYAFLKFEEKNIFSLQIGYITLANKINNFP